MDKVFITSSWQSNQAVKGWGTSLVLHTCLALAAFVLLPKMAMVVQDEPFKWDVAMVEPPRDVAPPEEPAPTPKVQPSPPVKPQPVRAVPTPPQPQQRQVETRVAPQPIQRTPQPVVEAIPPQQNQPTQELVQAQPKQVEPQEIQKSEPVVQAAVPAEIKRDVAPAVEQTLMESASATAQTYEAQPVVTAPPVVETTPEPIVTAAAPVVHSAPAAEPTPVDPAPAPATESSAAPSEPEAAPSTPSTEPVAPTEAVATAPSSPVATKEPEVVASAAISRTPKADNKWLADSLHRRISELKKYPSMARMNGWEGKVVLKVSIRHDGELKDVQVVTSSGHASLDQAAIEAVRRACPLHMQHELTAPMIVLHLPVNYRLSH